jgi:putative cardiolipin synthase
VKLYEFQPLASTQKISAFGSKGASLHTKAFAIDGSVGFVGTFNFDPRSASLNAEMGVVFEDEALVAELHEAIKKDLSPDVSYQLHLAGRKLKWIGRSSGRLVEFANEPHAGPARRLLAAIIGWLPIESQL